MLAASLRTLWIIVFASSLVLGLAGCGALTVPYLPETTVTPLASEDLAGPCTYALRLAQGPVVTPGQPPESLPQTGVLVVFDRGDSMTLFDDPAVIATAQKLHLAMLYAYQCDAQSFDDLQPNAAAGPGRALFQALTQFAVSQNHPELASANVFLTGFSAAGFLSASTAIEYPSRVLGVIPYAPGSSHADLDYLDVTQAAAQVPTLVLVNASDTSAGDQFPFFYFQHGASQGGPWGIAAQRAMQHCCVDSIAPILIPWVTAIYNQYTVTQSNGMVARAAETGNVPPTVAFQLYGDGIFDGLGWQDFYFTTYSVLPSTSGGPFQAWLPDAATTQAWETWITAPNGN
jgi:hypothetical protein